MLSLGCDCWWLGLAVDWWGFVCFGLVGFSVGNACCRLRVYLSSSCFSFKVVAFRVHVTGLLCHTIAMCRVLIGSNFVTQSAWWHFPAVWVCESVQWNEYHGIMLACMAQPVTVCNLFGRSRVQFPLWSPHFHSLLCQINSRKSLWWKLGDYANTRSV